MLKRREFLTSTVTVATVVSTGVLSGDLVSTNSIRYVVFDEQVEESVAFARELESRGARLFSVEHDIGRLWFGPLGEAYDSQPGAIAGLTAHSQMQVSVAFARERRARLRFEGEHDCRGCEVLTHSLRMNKDLMPLGDALVQSHTLWPRTLAVHLAQLDTRADIHGRVSLRTRTPRSATHPGSLFSWVLA